MDLRFALAPLLCGLVSCSLLFGESAPSGGQGDGGAAEIDSGLDDLCSGTARIDGTTVGLGIAYGERLDLDGDGLEDVVISTSAEVGRPRSFVHYGKCPRFGEWSYQFQWDARLAEPGAEEFEVRALALARGDGDEDRLVAIGQTAAGARLASFVMSGGVPSANSEFARPVPQSGGSICREAQAPFFLVTGNFDEDTGRSANDVGFSDANQPWRYLVGAWDFPTDWDVTCEGGNVTGAFPDQVSEPGGRVGVLSVSRGSPLLDEFIDVGSDGVGWSGYGSFSFSLVDVQGMGTGRVALDDDRPDLVIWNQESPKIDIGSVELNTASGGAQRSMAITQTSVDVEGLRPTDAVLIQYENQDYIAIAAGSTLRYFSVGSGFSPLVIPLAFDPVVMLTVNWGSEGADQILLFNGENGAYLCFEATAAGVLSAC